MINSVEDLRSAGVLPSGPVSAWPQERNVAGPEMQRAGGVAHEVVHDTEIKTGIGKMFSGAVRVAGQALTHGKVSEKIRNQRYDICKQCPHFIEESKRCSECGCFMEAKTWVAGDPKLLCPKKKWSK